LVVEEKFDHVMTFLEVHDARDWVAVLVVGLVKSCTKVDLFLEIVGIRVLGLSGFGRRSVRG
jgi:hypothetical protein